MNWHTYFDYNPDTGDLVWKERPLASFKTIGSGKIWNGRFSGKAAGTTDRKGYLVCMIGGSGYRAHRIIWEMMVGPIPKGMVIDHINGLEADNRIQNLRCCSDSQNKMNRPKDRTTASGLKGVYANKKGWCSKIKEPMGRMIHLGTYPTKGEAALVFAKASLRYHGKFSIFYRSVAGYA